MTVKILFPADLSKPRGQPRGQAAGCRGAALELESATEVSGRGLTRTEHLQKAVNRGPKSSTLIADGVPPHPPVDCRSSCRVRAPAPHDGASPLCCSTLRSSPA